MDKFLSNFSGGVPLQLDDFRWFLSQSGNSGIYAYFDELQRDFGNDLILQGCVVSGTNPNKSLTEGWILLGGEVLKVDAIAGTLDTSTDSHYIKFTTFDATGQKLLRNGDIVQTFEKARGKLQGTSGSLRFDAVSVTELQRAVQLDAASVETKIILKKKVLEIGDWNLDADQVAAVPHGLGSDYKNIRSIDVIIRDDADTFYTPLVFFNTVSEVMDGGINFVDSTNVNLARLGGGGFDNTGYDSTSFNRGWVTLLYEAP